MPMLPRGLILRHLRRRHPNCVCIRRIINQVVVSRPKIDLSAPPRATHGRNCPCCYHAPPLILIMEEISPRRRRAAAALRAACRGGGHQPSQLVGGSMNIAQVTHVPPRRSYCAYFPQAQWGRTSHTMLASPHCASRKSPLTSVILCIPAGVLNMPNRYLSLLTGVIWCPTQCLPCVSLL